MSVDEDARTSDERVDIDAESTSTMTTAITIEGRSSSIVGMIESKPPAGDPFTTSSFDAKSLPKPPRK